MRSRLVAVLMLFAVASFASVPVVYADTIAVSNGPYQVSFTDPVPVGAVEGLVATTLKLSNTSGVDANNPFTFNGQIGINGMLHHEQFQLPFPPFTQTPTPTQLSSGGSIVDSHFVRPAALTIAAESEPLINDASSAEPGQFAGRTGYGGPLMANIALGTGADPPPPTIDLAYLVFKNEVFLGSGIDFSFIVASATGGVGEVGLQGVIRMGAPPNEPPVVGNLGPLLGDMNLCDGPCVVSATLPVTDEDPSSLMWTLEGFSGVGLDGTTPANPFHIPTVNMANGLFEWDVNGSQRGMYTAVIRAKDNANQTGDGMLTIEVRVPEPSSIALASLALIGLVGLARRRG